MMRLSRFISAALLALPATAFAQGPGGQNTQNRPDFAFKVDIPADDARLTALKNQSVRMIDSMSTLTQQMVDMLFSFGELGFQEEETQKYLTGILERNGFRVTRGDAGVPTAWTATRVSPAGAQPEISH